MDMKKQVVDQFRAIGVLNADIAEHWSMAQESVADGRVDDTISLLNAYFRLKEKLEGVEAQLKGTLKGYFSDK